jgi:oligopeptide/dipeptide ABC transporter ATP-binding protein
MSVPLLEIKKLTVDFETEEGILRAVNNVSFTIEANSTLGIVGESGCGKTVTAMSIMRLLPEPPAKISSGQIIINKNGNSVDLAKLTPHGRLMRKIRGNEIAMIFQEPMTALNPVYTIGRQILEGIQVHRNVNRREGLKLALKKLKEVGIPSPEQRLHEYPHQLSGGMRQRAMIAMALACEPSLLIADEPTTALDVTIQAQVLGLMNHLRADFQASIMFITHDLGVIAKMADKVIVMYLGHIVESAPVRLLYRNPRHPYTKGLMKSIPSLASVSKSRLQPIEGSVPGLGGIPPGCVFEPRCPYRQDICQLKMPPLRKPVPEHLTACLFDFEDDGRVIR